MSSRSYSPALAFVFALCCCACAGGASRLDWTTWQSLPTFHDGRMMPVNTFARTAVEKICGKADPLLAPPEKWSQLAAMAPAEAERLDASVLFPGGKPRTFPSAELLFGWLAEPERWEHVPFLLASREELRTELLGVPAKDARGNRLKYVSPWQVAHAEKLRERLRKLADEQQMASARGQRMEMSALDARASELWQAYSLYRMISFDPSRDVHGRGRFFEKLDQAVATWQGLEADLVRLQQANALGEAGPGVLAIARTLVDLSQMAQSGEVPLDRAEPLVLSLKQAAASVAARFAEQKSRAFGSEPPPGMDRAQFGKLCAQMQVLAARTATLARQADDVHLALYESNYALRLVPALSAAALERNRDAADDIQPWLSVQAIRWGSDALLKGYPPKPIADFRTAFRKAREAYSDRGNPRRAQAFAAATQELETSLRALGTDIEPLRQKLPVQQRDEDLLAATKYPPPGATWVEVHYYRLDPFYWSWVVNLAAMAVLALAFGVLRKPFFWLGLAVLVAAQLLTAYGFALRVAITGWAPVTNMFETVVFVSLVVALLALGFVLQPVLGPGVKRAWRLTGIPGSWEHRLPAGTPTGLASGYAWLGVGMIAARVLLGAAVFWVLAVVPYGAGEGRPVFEVWPPGNDLLAWLVGICILAAAVWLVPRAAMAALLSLATVVWELARSGVSRPLEAALARKPFALVGASLAFVVALLAYFMPVWDKDINPLMPVLRDRLWLFAHVLTITAGYGAGALAWGLGNIALGYYLFGRYRDPTGPMPVIPGEEHRPAQGAHVPAEGRAHRAPEACASLAHFIYKAVQVAVILLTVGTILGGVWADRSWGRFWGWDPKEVWALISVIIYVALLHGRYAGWSGNFGLAAGSVVGMISIVWAWYGVNFLMGPGLHSYAGEGGGGGVYVFSAFGLNLLLVVIAGIRYYLETRAPARLPAPPGSAAQTTQLQQVKA